MEMKFINVQQIIQRIISKSHGFTLKTDSRNRLWVMSSRIFASEIVKYGPDESLREIERDINKKVSGVKGHFELKRNKAGEIISCEIEFGAHENNIRYSEYNYKINSKDNIYENFRFTQKVGNDNIIISLGQYNGQLLGAKYGKNSSYITTNMFSKKEIPINFGTWENTFLMDSIEVPKDEKYLGNAVKVIYDEVKEVCLMTEKDGNMKMRIKKLDMNKGDLQNESARMRIRKEFREELDNEYEIIQKLDNSELIMCGGNEIKEDTAEYEVFRKKYQQYIGSFEGLESQDKYSIAGLKKERALEER